MLNIAIIFKANSSFFDEFALPIIINYQTIALMKTKIIFRLASFGILLTSFFLLDYSSLTLSSNTNKYIMILVSILLWFIPNFLYPIQNLQKSIFYLNILIAFLAVFFVINIISILLNPSNLKSYGWVFVSICFISFYLLVRKENKRKLEKQSN